MSDRLPHENQSAKSVLLILAFLFCLLVFFVSVAGFVGFQVYRARRAAVFAERAELERAEQARAEARKEQVRAMEEKLKIDMEARRKAAELEKAKWEIENDDR